MSRKGLERWSLIAILCFGFILRVWGIGFGLPDLYHADEPALVNHALAHGTGDLNPHYFKLPALLNYYLFAFYTGYFLIGKVFGWFPTVESFAHRFLEDPSSFYLIGRGVTGLFWGTLGIYLVYRLGRRVSSRRVGLLAALFLACSFLPVRDSHYVIYDIPLMTVLIADLIVLVLLIKRRNLRSYLLFGALAGLTTAVKYNGALIVLPYLAAHGIKCRAEGETWQKTVSHPYLWAGLATVAVFYALGNPFSLIDFKAFWKDLATQAASEGGIGLLHHLRYSLNEGMGWPLLSLGLIGMGVYFTRNLSTKVIALFSFFWLLYISLYSQPYERYALPLVPLLCLGAAEMVDCAARRLGLLKRPLVVVLLTVALVAVPLSYSLYADFLFTQPDVRTLAKKWIESNLPAGSKVVLDYSFHQPRLRFVKRQLEGKLREIGGDSNRLQRLRLDYLLKGNGVEKPAYELYFLDEGDPASRPLFARPTLPFDIRALKRTGVDYVLITRLTEQYEHPEFYSQLKDQAERMMVFLPYRDQTLGHGLARVRQTAAATEGKDLFARERYGDIIEVFRLR